MSTPTWILATALRASRRGGASAAPLGDGREPEYPEKVDPLTQHDIALSQQVPPAAKLAQALELMETGIRLKRAALRVLHPEATAGEIDQALERWLLDDG